MYQKFFKFFVTVILLLIFQQSWSQKVLKGLVVGNDNSGLSKVSVSSGNGKYGTSTADDGTFTLTVPNTVVDLVFSSIGYKQQKIKIGNTSFFTVKMVTNIATGDDAVVIGYGSRKKEDLSGAVTQVGAEFIGRQPITSVDQGLAGLVPGVVLREGTGAPGAGPEILIRGINTFGNNKPLIVIDDVIFESGNDQNNNPLALLNPEDIENVVVLKDAATKAIYGSRATGGVILITTKKGKIGKSKISFNSSVGIAEVLPFEKPDVLNANELAQFRKDVAIDKIRAHGQYTAGSPYAMYAAAGVPVPDAVILGAGSVVGTAIPIASYIDPSQYGKGTDWFDVTTRQALTQNYNISLNGGSDQFRYFLSGNYLNQEGVVIANDIKRYSIRSNFDVKVTSKIKFGMNLNTTITDANRSADDPSGGQFSAYSTITSTYWIDPSVSPYQSNGLYNYTTRGNLNSNWTANPVYQLEIEQEKRRNTQLLSGAFIEFQPIKGLTWRSSINYQFNQQRSRNFQPSNLVGDGSLTPVFPNLDSARAVLFNQNTNNVITDNNIRYAFDYKRHGFNFFAGINTQDHLVENSSANAKKILDENFILPNFSNVSLSSPGNFTGSTGYSRNRLLSYIGRLNYNFDDRYLLNFSVRRDGNSRFGRNVQYGTFPAGSVTWKATKEKFIKNIIPKWINDVRFEVGYGLTGNSNGVGAYEHLGGISQTNYSFGGGGLVLGNSLSGLPNAGLTWEKSNQLDLGMNAAFWKNRVNVAFNYYSQETGGLLAGVPLSWITGFGSVIGNQESRMRNTGWEAQADVMIVRKKDFSWKFGINASAYKNTILEYFLPAGFTSGNAGNGTQVAISRPGDPVGLFRGLKITGVYSAADITDPKVPKYAGAREGGIKYEDGNGDGTLNGNVELDYQILGSPHPDLMFGFNNQFQYKGFGIRTIFAGQIGGLIYDLRREIMWNVDGNFNVERQVLNRWRPGDTEYNQQFGSSSFNTNLYRLPSDNKVYDGSYLALKNLNFTYNLTKLLNKKRKLVEGADVNIGLRNVFYLSSYKYGNPEVRRSNDGSALRSINYGSYPINRSFNVGFNLTF